MEETRIVSTSPSEAATQQELPQESSPESEFRKVLEGIHKGERNDGLDEDQDDPFDGEWFPRKVCYSPIFGPQKIIPALVLALRCGFESLLTAKKKELPNQNGGVQGTCAYVDEKALLWTDIPTSIRFNYTKFPGPSTKKFYLWTSLGRGSTGQAFLACNSSGNVCVAKFFLLDEKQILLTNKEHREAMRESLKTASKVKAKTEMNHWQSFYGEKNVRVVELNNLWCLLMPYFDHVMTNEREQALPKVMELLESFKQRGFNYKMNDLRWRHVYQRFGEITLIDLCSLEKIKEGESIDIGKLEEHLQGSI
jgi:hypothetical protein